MKTLVSYSIIAISSLGAISSAIACRVPSQNHYEYRIAETYQFSKGEKILKDIVLAPETYQLREDIKGLQKKYNGERFDRNQATADRIKEKFDQMLEVMDFKGPIKKFPYKEATSEMQGSSEEVGLEVTMKDLSQEDLQWLPTSILNKLGKKAKVLYRYPEKKFEYFLTYDNKEIPIQRATQRMQMDYETECLKIRSAKDPSSKGANSTPATGSAGPGGNQQ